MKLRHEDKRTFLTLLVIVRWKTHPTPIARPQKNLRSSSEILSGVINIIRDPFLSGGGRVLAILNQGRLPYRSLPALSLPVFFLCTLFVSPTHSWERSSVAWAPPWEIWFSTFDGINNFQRLREVADVETFSRPVLRRLLAPRRSAPLPASVLTALWQRWICHDPMTDLPRRGRTPWICHARPPREREKPLAVCDVTHRRNSCIITM